MMGAGPRTWGANSVLITPFFEDGRADLDSLRRLVEYQLAAQVAGVVCFGLAPENYRLSNVERDAILQAVVIDCRGRSEVIVGCEYESADIAATRTAAAVRAGADAIMAFHPSALHDGIVRIFFAYMAQSMTSRGRAR